MPTSAGRRRETSFDHAREALAAVLRGRSTRPAEVDEEFYDLYYAEGHLADRICNRAMIWRD